MSIGDIFGVLKPVIKIAAILVLLAFIIGGLFLFGGVFLKSLGDIGSMFS